MSFYQHSAHAVKIGLKCCLSQILPCNRSFNLRATARFHLISLLMDPIIAKSKKGKCQRSDKQFHPVPERFCGLNLHCTVCCSSGNLANSDCGNIEVVPKHNRQNE